MQQAYELSAAELTAWVGTFFWPFFRVTAVMMIAPVFSGKQMPKLYRLGLGFVLTVAMLPLVGEVPQVDAFSAQSILITLNQIVIGLAMGFVLLLVINAVILGAEAISMSMGLGFAVMTDPANGGQVAVIGQFYMVLSTLLFLVFNGHLALIELIGESFRVLPVSTQGLPGAGIWTLLQWASMLFEGALSVALPAIAALLSVNLAMGIITRAAPQLNIFSVGFPITMTLGFILMILSLPMFLPEFENLLADGFEIIQALFNGVP